MCHDHIDISALIDCSLFVKMSENIFFSLKALSLWGQAFINQVFMPFEAQIQSIEETKRSVCCFQQAVNSCSQINVIFGKFISQKMCWALLELIPEVYQISHINEMSSISIDRILLGQCQAMEKLVAFMLTCVQYYFIQSLIGNILLYPKIQKLIYLLDLECRNK